MHIIFPPSPFLFFIFSQENMAAVHPCSVPLARLSSLEVVSHTGRGEVEVSEHTSLPGRGSLWVLEGGKAPLCVGLFIAVGTRVCYIEPVVWGCYVSSLSRSCLGNTTVKILFWSSKELEVWTDCSYQSDYMFDTKKLHISITIFSARENSVWTTDFT